MKKFIESLFVSIIAVFSMANVFAANVAKIGDVEYATIDAAIDAWKEGDEIKLLCNLDIADYFVKTKNFVIDGCGYTLKCTKAHDGYNYFVNNNGFTQTFKNITIDGNKQVAYAAQCINASSTLILDNVTLKGGKTTVLQGLMGYGLHINKGNVIANDLKVSNCDAAAVYIDSNKAAGGAFTLTGDNCDLDAVGVAEGTTPTLSITAKGFSIYDVSAKYSYSIIFGTREGTKNLSNVISALSWNQAISEIQNKISGLSVKVKSATVTLKGDVKFKEDFTSNESRLTVDGAGKTVTGKFIFNSSTPTTIKNIVLGNGSVLDCTASTRTGFSGVSVAANTSIDILLPASTDMNSYALPVSLATDAVANIFVGDKKYIAKNGVISSAEKLAQIGDKQYATLQEAIDAANGATVQVLKDVALTASLNVPAGKTLTLNLAGRKVTVSGADYALVNNGNLTIVDMGLVTVVAAEATVGDETTTPILIMAPSANDGVAVIDDATGGSIAGVQNNGTFALESGAVVAASASVPAIDNAANAVATITGGTVEGKLQVADKTALTITGGTFTGESNVSEFVGGDFGVDSNGTIVKNVAKIGEVGYLTLYDAVSAAQAGDTIVLAEDVAISKPIILTKNVTIDGGNKTITPAADFVADGNGAVIVFANGAVAYSADRNYTVKNLTIEGFSGLTRVLRANFCDSLVENCSFVNNSVSEGVVTSSYGKTNVKDCTFDGNTSAFSIVNIGFDVSSGTELAVTVDGSEFVGNKAAIALIYAASSVAVTDNYFNGNVHSGNNANAAAVLAGPYTGTVSYTVDVSENAFVNAFSNQGGNVLPDVYAEDWSETWNATTSFDLSSNYWNGGEPNYAVSGKPSIDLTDYYTTYEEGVKGGLTEVKSAVAKIGEETFETIKAALDAVQEGGTIQLLAGTIEEGGILFPATLKNVTIKGAADKQTVVKNTTFGSFHGGSVHYEDITIDGIVFDGSQIVFTGARTGEVVYKNWTISNCEFRNIVNASNSAIHFNLAADETLEGLTFVNNVIDGVTGGNISGLRANYLSGDIVIVGNRISNVAWNAIQLIHANVGTYTIENNVLASGAAEGILNLYNTTATTLSIANNQFLVTEGQAGIGYLGSGDVSANYWGGEAPANLPEGVTFVNYYTTVAEDGTLGGLMTCVAKIGNKSYATLQAAVNAAQEGDTVTLLNNVAVNNNDAYGLMIEKAITIDGNGKTITVADGYANTYALMYLYAISGKVTIKNLTFDGVKSGAAIWAHDADVEIDNCVFQNGEHTQVQGLVRTTCANLTVKNSQFKNNNCNFAITFNYDAAESDTMLVENCDFVGNTVNDTAIVYYVDGASSTIKDCKFVDNTVKSASHGAVVYYSNGSNGSLTGNVFSGNKITAGGVRASVLALEAGTTASENAFVDNTCVSTASGTTYVGTVLNKADADSAGVAISGNYWGGNEPDCVSVKGASTALDNYYTSYDNGVLGGLVEVATPIAQVGDVKFTSVLEAINYAVENGSTEIKLLADSRELMPADIEIILKANLTITADAPVTAAFYNNGTSYDFIIDCEGYGDYDFTIGENVTFVLEDRIVWVGYYGSNIDVAVDGTLSGSQIWAGGDIYVKETGTLKSTGEAFVIRRGKTVFVDGGKIEANYFNILSGNIFAENGAEIECGALWIANTGSYANEGNVSITLWDSTLTAKGNLKSSSSSSVYIDIYDSTVEIKDVHGYGVSVLDANTTLYVNGENGALTINKGINNSGTIEVYDGGELTVPANASVTNNGSIILEAGSTIAGPADMGVEVEATDKEVEYVDGKYVAVDKKVAQIGETFYATLQAAIDAARSGDTVVLLAEATGDVTVAEGCEVIIDLNGNDIVGTLNAIVNNGTLTINDTVGTGNVYTTDVSAQGRAAIVNRGTIVINGGWFGDANNDTSDRNAINRGNALKNYGTAIVNGGYFTNVSNQYIGSDAYAYAINTLAGGTTVINEATVYGDINGLIYSDGKTTVNGGSFTLGRPGEENNLWYLAYGDVVIKGGTWDRAFKVPSWNPNDPKFNGNVVVSGGDFNIEIPETYRAEGYQSVKQPGKDLWQVGKLPNAEVINVGPYTVDVGAESYYIYNITNKTFTSGHKDEFDLQVTLGFIANDTVEEAAANAYGQYLTDFRIKIEGIENGSFVADEDCYLAGYYPFFGGWVKVNLDGMTIENNVGYPVITGVTEMPFTYETICDIVQSFICGIHLSDEVLQANPNLRVSLELGLAETQEKMLDGTGFITVGDTYDYTVDELQGAVALTGADYYTTVDAAVAAALESGDFVKLVNDATLQDNLELAGALDINLSGNTLYANAKTLTITDSVVTITNGTLSAFTKDNVTLSGNAVLTVTDKNVADSFRQSDTHYVSQNMNGTYSIMLKSAFRVFITMVDGEPRIGFFQDFAQGAAACTLLGATSLENADWTNVEYTQADDASGASALPLYWVKLNQDAEDTKVYLFFKIGMMQDMTE